MKNSLNWVWEIITAILNIGMAFYQAKWFDAHMNGKTKFNHWPWAMFYGILLGFSYFIDHSIILVVELLLIRGILFNIALNLTRKKVNLPVFYIHAAKEGGSWIDRIEGFIFGRWYPLFWATEFIGLVLLNIFFRL